MRIAIIALLLLAGCKSAPKPAVSELIVGRKYGSGPSVYPTYLTCYSYADGSPGFCTEGTLYVKPISHKRKHDTTLTAGGPAEVQDVHDPCKIGTCGCIIQNGCFDPNYATPPQPDPTVEHKHDNNAVQQDVPPKQSQEKAPEPPPAWPWRCTPDGGKSWLDCDPRTLQEKSTPKVDVPPVTEEYGNPGIEFCDMGCHWIEDYSENGIPPHRRTRLTCADKSRFLMTAEDGSMHCIILPPGDLVKMSTCDQRSSYTLDYCVTDLESFTAKVEGHTVSALGQKIDLLKS